MLFRSVLRAYMTTGLSIPEINSLLAQGATISDDGTIQLASTVPPAEEPGEDVTPAPVPEQPTTNESETPQVEDKPDTEFTSFAIIAGILIVLLGLVVFIVLKKRKQPATNDRTEEGGGIER